MREREKKNEKSRRLAGCGLLPGIFAPLEKPKNTQTNLEKQAPPELEIRDHTMGGSEYPGPCHINLALERSPDGLNRKAAGE